MPIKYLSPLSRRQLENKTAILRIDINAELDKNKKPIMSERFKASAKTIDFLKSKGAKIICIAHQGQPGKYDFSSLEKHSKVLNRLTKIIFINDITGNKAQTAIKNLKPGQAILLENIRFNKDEFNPDKKDNEIIKNLVPLANIYINDAFSVCHREQTSIVSFPKHLKSYAGLTLEKELKSVEKIKVKNALFVLGGNKPVDLIQLTESKNKMLAGGSLVLLPRIAKGYKLGKEEQVLKSDLHLIKDIKPYLKKMVLPIDLAISVNEKRKDISLSDLPVDYPVYDISYKTIEHFKHEIVKAKAIFVKGPMGFFGKPGFNKGTKEILKEVAKSNAFTIMAGGHTSNALSRIGVNKNKINYISLSGGALVEYISGRKLPGIEALKK